MFHLLGNVFLINTANSFNNQLKKTPRYFIIIFKICHANHKPAVNTIANIKDSNQDPSVLFLSFPYMASLYLMVIETQ